MKSIPEKFVSPGAMLCLAMMAVILVHTGDRSVHAQDVIPPAFDAAVPSAVDDGSHVEQVDFQPMEIPQEDLADPSPEGSFASDIAADEDFSVPDELFAELEEAEAKDHGFAAGIREHFADLDLTKMLGSLAIVLGGYFGIVWFMRKFNPGSSGALPTEVVEVLGTTPFGPKKHLQVIRLGNKLLLLMNSAEGSQMIGEVSDPEEVEYLASLCVSKRKRRAASSRLSRRSSAQVSMNQSRRSPATDTPPAPPAADNLRDVLQQLQNVVRSQSNGSVFEA
ncbi:MAG: flagellar biosynthetic protein FliO [Mariniblastus sp.]|nr:flagellar biosynthetic protein FliO [Mariniblastus sp.]